MRDELASQVEAVWLSTKRRVWICGSHPSERATDDSVCKTLTTFHGCKRIYLRCSNVGQAESAALLQGMKVAGPSTFAAQIIHLDLSRFLVRFCEDLALVLRKCSALEHLDFSDNLSNSAESQALAQALTNCSRLTFLNLSSNRVRNDGIREFASLLSQCPLTHLDLSNNALGLTGEQHLPGVLPATGQLVLADILGTLSSLTHLNLRSNSLGPTGGASVAHSIIRCPHLLHLDLGCNNFGPSVALGSLAVSLAQCRSLQVLSLKGLNFGAQGTGSIARALSHCSELRELDLSSNRIGVEGAGRLTELLEACTKLETIDLSWNCIDSEGVRRFAPGLQQTSALHTLALTDNNIGTAGARYLAELLPSLKSLRFLRLSLTDIRSEGLAEIGEAVGAYNGGEYFNFVANIICLDLSKRRWF